MTSVERSQSRALDANQPQPAIVIDPAVKESVYSLIEAQRHSHELAVTQLMVALEETHRECRFLRQQLSTSNEMLQESQLQLRRVTSDKEILLGQLQDRESQNDKLVAENQQLKKQVQEDMKELAEVREMVKNAMEETYRSRQAIQQNNNNNNNNKTSSRNEVSPSRQLLDRPSTVQNYEFLADPNNNNQANSYYSPPNNTNHRQQQQPAYQGYGSSDYPASQQGIRAGIAFGAVSPPRVRDDHGGAEPSELKLTNNHHNNNIRRFAESPVEVSVNRNSQGEMTLRVDSSRSQYQHLQQQQQSRLNNNNTISSNLIAIGDLSSTNAAASVPRSLMNGNPVTISYSSSGNNNSNNNNNIFRPITVDLSLSRAVSVSPQGHVCISVADEELNQAALCVYRDLRITSQTNTTTLIFEASFRSSNPNGILVGLATVKSNSKNDSVNNSNNSFTSAIGASSGLGARCAIRGDGVLLLATDDGNVFEAKSGLSVTTAGVGSGSSRSGSAGNNNSITTTSNGVITVQLEELTSKVLFAVNGDLIHTVPLQVPRSISGAPNGYLVPFVSLPNSGDEVVVRAPLRV